MPKFTRMSALALAVFMLIVVAGCSAQGPNNRKIGILLPAGEDEFTKDAVRLAENEMQKLSAERNFSHTLMKAASANEQVNYFKTFVAETNSTVHPLNDEDKKKTPYGLIVLWPLDAQTFEPAAQSAREAGIPVLLCGQPIPGFAPTSSMIVDMEATAKMALAYMQGSVEGLSGIAVIGAQTGFGERFINVAGEKVVAAIDNPEPVSDARQAGKAAMEALLRDKPGAIEAVFVEDDAMALGVVDVIKANSGCGVKVVASVGGTKAFLDAMADSPVDMVTYAYSPAMMKAVMQIAADVAIGVSILPEYKVITTQVDKRYEQLYRESDEYLARYGG